MAAPFPFNPLPGDDEYEDDDFDPYEDEYPVD